MQLNINWLNETAMAFLKTYPNQKEVKSGFALTLYSLNVVIS